MRGKADSPSTTFRQCLAIVNTTVLGRHLDAPARKKYYMIEQRTSWTVPMATPVRYLSSLYIVWLQLLQAKSLWNRVVMCLSEDDRKMTGYKWTSHEKNTRSSQ